MKLHVVPPSRLERADSQTPTFFSLLVHVDSQSALSHPLYLLLKALRATPTMITKLNLQCLSSCLHALLSFLSFLKGTFIFEGDSSLVSSTWKQNPTIQSTSAITGNAPIDTYRMIYILLPPFQNKCSFRSWVRKLKRNKKAESAHETSRGRGGER